MSRTFLIIGGGGGIGAAFAQQLTGQGDRVVLVGRNRERLRAAAEGLPADLVHTLSADVTKPDEVERMVAASLAWSPTIDVLVNNAGAALLAPVETFPIDDWHRIIETNLTAVFLCCRAVVPIMKKQGHGLIVSICSVAGKQAFPNWAPYCASKWGLVGFSKALHEEVRGAGVRVTLLYPGGVDTPLWDNLEHKMDRAKMLTPDDVARALAYVAQQPAHMVVDEVSVIYAGGAQ